MITLERSLKLIFCVKNDADISGFALLKKVEKNVLKKQSF